MFLLMVKKIFAILGKLFCLTGPIIAEEERTDCFTSLCGSQCLESLPRDAVGCSLVSDSGISCADPERETGGPVPPPLKNHKNIGFLSNTSPDPLKNHKATKPAFNVGSSSARQRNAI